MEQKKLTKGGNWTHTTPEELADSFLRSGAKNTQAAYRADLGQFREFIGCKTIAKAVKVFCDMTPGAAMRIAEDYKQWLRNQGHSANTVRRRIGSLLGLAAKAKNFDILQWTIRVSLPPAITVRDTRGPSRKAVEAMINHSRNREDAKGMRDAAIVSLMFYNAMRSAEVLSIDLKHYNADEARVSVQAKARWDRETVNIARSARDAIDDWLAHRGGDPGPMFITLSPSAKGTRARLTYCGLYAIITTLGGKIGIRCRPHGLRHTAITEALRLTNGDIIRTMELSRHRNPQTVMAYADAWREKGRDVAELLQAGYPMNRKKPFDNDKDSYPNLFNT